MSATKKEAQYNFVTTKHGSHTVLTYSKWKSISNSSCRFPGLRGVLVGSGGGGGVLPKLRAEFLPTGTRFVRCRYTDVCMHFGIWFLNELCGVLSAKQMEGWEKTECFQTALVPPASQYLTQVFISSPTEKEAPKFFSSRNGCGQVLVIFALWWMKEGELWQYRARYRYCWGFAWEISSEGWVALSVHWSFTL